MQFGRLRFCPVAAPLLAVLCAAPAALAQDPPPPAATYAPPAQDPPPPPPPVVNTAAPAEAPAAPAADDTARPLPFTLGLGAGTVIGGTSVLAPNTASARFVLTDEWQLEPLVNLSISGTPAGDETANTTTIRVGALARYVYASNGPVDVQLLGGALLGFVAAEDANTLDLNLTYGASVVWYLSEHWSISGDATNPIVSLTNTSPDGADSTTQYTIGAIWNPTFSAMIHIYM